MEKKYLYFQPEYVSKFKCNGQLCSAHCCKRWTIGIDKKTYKKYSSIKPKTEANEITKHIFKNSDNNYIVRLDENQRCPMLTEDNWCSIQRKYGEDYLSQVCTTYPRRTFAIGDFFERSLSLTCPVVAVDILLPDEPMAFEQVEVSEKIHSNGGKISIELPPVPQNLLSHVYSIQFAAISILQERSLSIDERLIMLGFFLDKLDEIISAGDLKKIEDVAAIFSSEDFLKNETQTLVSSLNFDTKEYLRIIFGTLETLYGGDSPFAFKDQKFLDAVNDALEIQIDENNQVSLDSIVETYKKLDEFREKFMEAFSTIFENYLVNEFFLNLYPWKIPNSIIFNYGMFVTTYKLFELISLSLAVSNFKADPTKLPPLNKTDLTVAAMIFSNNVDHNKTYVAKISDYLKDKNDVVSLMQSLLQG